jgi:MoxR-like ATPase
MAEGDCVFHYLSGKSLHQAQSKVIVAVSRVKDNPQFLSRDRFLGKLKSYDLNKCPLPTNFVLSKEFINYYDLWHRYYADEFNKYDEFIFVEIEVIEWLRSRISIDDIRNRIPVLKRIRGSIVQGYLTPIRRKWALSILSSVFSGPAVKKIYHTLSATDFDFAILASLIAGKNLLLVGPPGSGKTNYIRDLLEGLGIDYVLRTGNPEWTAFDVVGGFDLQVRWRDGFITAAIRRSLKSKRPVWVVIDELNRANLDLALGEYFTFLDVEHRKKPFKAGDEELRVPYSLRILATMNSFDRSLLQKLGFALRRRFTVVDFARFRNLSHSKEEVEKFCERVANLPQCELQAFDSERALRVFELAESPDYAVIFSEVYDWFSENRESMLKIQVECSHAARSLDLRSLLACIIDEVNGELRGYSCEVCPVEITPGIAADALRFLAAARALDAVVSRGAPQSWRPEKLLYLLDFAVAAHVVPQLDALSGYVQIEGDKGQAARNLSGVADKFRGWGLKASAEYAEKLSRGFNVP